MTVTIETPQMVDAIGTRLRLRALGAMGHSQTRIARALGEPIWLINRIMGGVTREVSPKLRADALALYDHWWCLRPPETTPAERKAAAAARTRAKRCRWCTGAGLDDDELDVPGYRPRSTYRPAEGVGVATDPDPLGRRRSA